MNIAELAEPVDHGQIERGQGRDGKNFDRTGKFRSQSFFDRQRCYGLLGFDQVAWLDEVPGIERDVNGKYASDEAVVEWTNRLDRAQITPATLTASRCDAG